NKAATACEACFLLCALRGDERWVNAYVLSNLDFILEHQVHDRGQLDGAIAQNSFGRRLVEKYFPIYIARCVPALLQGYAWTDEERYLDAAMRAMDFIARWMTPHGGLPTV